MSDEERLDAVEWSGALKRAATVAPWRHRTRDELEALARRLGARLVEPPAGGSSPEELLRFLDAGVGPQQDREVDR